MEIINSLNISTYYAIILLINLGVAFILLTALKFISGVISNVNAVDELSQKDNTAFGISLASSFLAVTIMMTGVMTGSAHLSYLNEIITVFGYGVFGLVLMIITRFIFDRISLPNFSVKDEILRGNIATGIVDGGNVIATAIIIRAALVWIDGSSIIDGVFVLVAYVISQIILTLLSLYRIHAYKSDDNKCLQDALKDGNQALALRFSGYRIGAALAITAASSIVPYNTLDPVTTAGLWIAVSMIIMIIMYVMVFIADKIILYKIDINQEVNQERNNAVGLIHAIIIISIGLIITSLTS